MYHLGIRSHHVSYCSSWSAYAVNILELMGIHLPEKLITDFSSGGIMNLPAIIIISIMAMLQLWGTKESARLNNILVFVKLGVILLFIILVAKHVDPSNYTPISSLWLERCIFRSSDRFLRISGV